MSQICKAFEAHQFAKQHYRKLISAKSSVKKLKNVSIQAKYGISRTITPIDRYQYRRTNEKLCSKLMQIYDKPIKMSRKSKRKSLSIVSHSLNDYLQAEKGKIIEQDNYRILNRLVNTKSTIKQNWKQREKNLKKYSSLTRKRYSNNDENLYHAFRQLIVESHIKAKGSSSRSQSARPNSTKNQIKQSVVDFGF